MRILSLGWGKQSFTLAVMIALGELPPVACAVFVDTTHEASKTYKFAKKYTGWLENNGVKVITLTTPPHDISLADDDNPHVVDIPAFTLNAMGDKGQLNRQCTGSWKIAVIRRYLQSIRGKERIDQLIGISTDEAERMRTSDRKYIDNYYPLIEQGMSRMDCINYLNDHGFEIPERSACVFCPFRSADEWALIGNNTKDREHAILVDRKIRRARGEYHSFIHPYCLPFEKIDLRTQEEKGQLSLWQNECSGYCGN